MRNKPATGDSSHEPIAHFLPDQDYYFSTSWIIDIDKL